MPSDDLDLDSLTRDLATDIVGRPILWHVSVGSTNDLAKQSARSGAVEGLVILADEQIAGRGRQGRSWAAPPGSSLLLSLLLRPHWLNPTDTFAITMMAGVALCEAVEKTAPLVATLKWPNDLMLPASAGAPPSTHKAAGILSEFDLEGGLLSWVVVGMGVNVDWSPSGVVDGHDLALVATSLSAAAGRPVSRVALLRALLERLDARYHDLRQGRREELFAAWRGRLATLGQQVVVRMPRGELSGVAEGVELSGALLLRDEQGALHTVLAGDIGA
jgi:BirA family biotin operon repressor/biotin-[acetyl-CoA-carboxylase] ligase